MRVAIPVSDHRVARIFDSAPSLLIADLQSGGRIEYFEIPAGFRSLRERARELAAVGVDIVLCDEMSHALENMMLEQGVEIVRHVTGNVDEVLDGYRERNRRDPRLFRTTSPPLRELGKSVSSFTRS